MKNHSPGAKRRALVNVCLALLSTALSLMVIETAFRLMVYYDDIKTFRAFQNLGQTPIIQDPNQFISFRQLIRISKNPRIIYEFIPNLSLFFRGKQYWMNSHGFRGQEYSTTKSESVFRLVGLGDSVMWGWGVSDDEYYLALLQPYLNQSSPDGCSWEIINTAVPGYNTVMEVETFKEKGFRYNPDLVIIDYVGNDLSLPNFIRKENDYFGLRRSFALEFFSSQLTHRHKIFYDGLMDASPDQIGQGFESDPSRVPNQYKDMVGIDAYRSSMADLKSLSVKHDFHIVVFTHGRIPDVLKEILRDLYIPVLEGFEVLEKYMIQHDIKEYLGSPLTVSREDPHPSALAHAILAGVLYNYLKESDILGQILKRRGIISVSK